MEESSKEWFLEAFYYYLNLGHVSKGQSRVFHHIMKELSRQYTQEEIGLLYLIKIG